MLTIKEFEIENELEKLQNFCSFVEMEVPTIYDNVKTAIKQLCVERLCKTIGITCAVNVKNEFFNFFSCIVGQVIVEKLNLNLHIDDFNLKYVKFGNVNLIFSAKMLLENDNLDEAFINIFNLADKYKFVIELLR